jgi:GT2 family glycosyltransferase
MSVLAPTAAPERAATAVGASIVLVSYNGSAYLKRALRSVLDDPAAAEAEVVVVDNASADGSADLVEREFPSVRLVRSKRNLGFGQACNLGAGQSSGRYLVFLNQDTVVEPGWFGELIGALEAEPAAGLATSQILLLSDPGQINTCGNQIHLTGLTLCRGLGEPAESHGPSGPRRVSAVSGAAFAIRRGLFEQLGGFDGEFFMYVEDSDLSWRARLAGWHCLYVPSSVVYHDYALRFSPDKVFFLERNRYRMLLKTLRLPTLLVLAPGLLAAELVTWAFALRRGPRFWRSKPRAYGAIWREPARLARARRATQRQRRVGDRVLLAEAATALAYEQGGAGFAARAAHLLFDPLFLVQRRLALGLVRW